MKTLSRRANTLIRSWGETIHIDKGGLAIPNITTIKTAFRLALLGEEAFGEAEWKQLFSPLHRQRHRRSCTLPKPERTDGDKEEENMVV